MPDNNGERTTHEWLIHIDRKLGRIDDKLSAKADKLDLIRAEHRLLVVEQRTTRLVTMRDTIWAGLLVVSHFIARMTGLHG